MTIQNVGAQAVGKSFSNGINTSEKESKSNKSGIDNFTTVEYTSQKDGKTYVAKKITLKQNGEELTGIYVYDKSAKPDKKGQIQGEFMSFDTFMKKMASELPRVDVSNVKAYNPNIKTMSLEERFDKGLESGVKLSDGSILIRPTVLNTGSTEIKPSKNGEGYDVIFTSFVGGYRHEPSIRTMSEDELINNKSLSGGTIKKLDDNSYEVTYYNSTKRSDHEMTTEIMDKESCMKFLSSHCMHL